MNILVVNYEYPPIGGGGGVICKDIAEEIASKGHRVTVVTSQYGSLPPQESQHGVTIIRLPVVLREKKDVASFLSMISYVPLCMLNARTILQREKFDVIHTHFAIPSGPAGQYISDRFGIPNVLSIHGGDIYDPSKSLSPHDTFGLKQTVRKMLMKADRVVAQSSDTKANAERYYGVDREIDIVPLGIRPNPYPVKSRQVLGLPVDRRVFSTIGRLVRRKNIEDLLHVMKAIRETDPSVLLIMGDGPEKDSIEKTVRDLGIGDSVRLMGRVSEEQKYECLSASDGYLSTAMHEGFGIVFLEAMECGLPVICYDKGGQRDFLKNGKTGYLVPLGNREEFVARVRELLQSDRLKAEIGEHNRTYVREFYIGSVAERYLSIFREAIS